MQVVENIPADQLVRITEPVATITSGGTATANENIGTFQEIYTATSNDTTATYSLRSGLDDDAGSFFIDSNTGKVVLLNNPDFETKNNYTFTVLATDIFGNTSPKQVNLIINDRKELPDDRINTTTANIQDYSSIGALTDGGFVVTWTGLTNVSGSDHIWSTYLQRYNADGIAQNSELLVSNAAGNVAPSVTTLTGGGYVVSWFFAGDDGISDIHSRLYNASGVEQNIFISSSHLYADENPSVTGLAGGGFVITYTSKLKDSTPYSIYAQRYDANGVSQGNEFKVNTIDGTYDTQNFSTVAALADGGFIITWQSYGQDGDGWGIYGQRYDANGNRQGAEFLVNTTTATDQIDSAVTALADGSFVVVWSSADNHSVIKGQRFDAAGSVQGAEFLVSKSAVLVNGDPSIAALIDGGFVVIWTSEDGSSKGIQGQRYDANGNVQGAEFKVNSYTTSEQIQPSVTALIDGSFVVTWSSYGQDGSEYGIYSKRYDSNGNEVKLGNLAAPLVQLIGSDSDTAALVESDGSLATSGTLSISDNDGSDIVTASVVGLIVNGNSHGINEDVLRSMLRLTPNPVLDGVASGVLTWQFDSTLENFDFLNQDENLELVYTVQLDDRGLGGTEHPITISITGSNDGPKIIAPQVDQAMKYDTTDWSYDASISFNDTDTSDSLSYSATLANGNPLPLWMQFNTATGFITGTPSLADRGTYALIVTVTDSHGLSVSAPLTIAVILFDAGKLLVNTAGNDTLIGTLSNDTVTYYHSAAPVTVSLAIATQQDTGGAGLDTLTNIDNLIGSDYNDRLVGDAKNNILDGGIGNDTLNGNLGADTLIGGLGDDYYLVDDEADTIIENINEGTDTINSNMTYTLLANVENLTLRDASAINGTGNELANTITGNAAANQLNGGAGNDKLNGAAGADSLIGGLGDDFYNVDNEADTVIENIDEGTDKVSSSVTYTLSANVENLTLTGGSAINGTGNGLANTITGNAAINVLNGGAGTDRLIGGLGDDIYTVENAGDVTTENLSEGIDKVSSSVTYMLPTNVENLTLTGALAINGIGNDLANSITGNAASNQLNGGSGNDTLNGAAGADNLIGGLGDDSYIVDNAGDVVTENSGEGADKVSSTVTYILPLNVENLTLWGTSAINGTGNELANSIAGNAASNQLNGGAGNDTLNGAAGADSLIGGLGNDFYNVDNEADTIIENINEGTDKVSSSVTYTLSANVENLILRDASAINGTGNDLANSITGNTASNQLDGGAGNDIFDGGAGADMLTGGIGKDIFKLTSSGHIDTITDFIVVDDTIQLENAVFTSLTTTGTLAFDQFVSGVQALDTNDFIIYNNVTGSLLYDADGSGVGSAVKIAAIGVGLAMTNADIVVI